MSPVMCRENWDSQGVLLQMYPVCSVPKTQTAGLPLASNATSLCRVCLQTSSFQVFIQAGDYLWIIVWIIVGGPKEGVQDGPSLVEGSTYFTAGTGPPTLGRARALEKPWRPAGRPGGSAVLRSAPWGLASSTAVSLFPAQGHLPK